MKDTEHPVRHPRVHLPDRASVRRRRGCARRNGQYGRGMAPSLARATPLFATCLWRKNRGVDPAQQMRVVPACTARIRTEHAKRIRITFFSFVLGLHLAVSAGLTNMGQEHEKNHAGEVTEFWLRAGLGEYRL